MPNPTQNSTHNSNRSEVRSSDHEKLPLIENGDKETDADLPIHTNLRRFGLLTKFMLPLIVTQLVPDIADLVLNRSITSIASSEMVVLLAAFGLASYACRLFVALTFEFSYVHIVLVHDIRDYKNMLIFVCFVSGLFCLILLLTGLTPFGDWLIGDIHQQSKEVTEQTLFIMSCLIPLPLLEGLAYYHEGGLIKFKLTMYVAIANFVDFGAQVLFVMVLLFTPTRSEPIIIPISALYAGTLGRFILDTGFWFVLVRRKLHKPKTEQKAVTLLGGCKFFTPLGVVKFVQATSRPLINLAVSRQLAQISEDLAAEAMAILTVVYPIGRVFFSWLKELRTIIPTFYIPTRQHETFPMKVLIGYGMFCTLAAFLSNAVLFLIPGPASYIMYKIVGVTPDLAEKSVVPLRIFAFICITVGIRATASSYIIYREKTVYLTPSAFVRFLAVVICVVIIPYVGMSGAAFGIASLLTSFIVEVIAVIFGLLLLKYVEPRFIEWKQKRKQMLK